MNQEKDAVEVITDKSANSLWKDAFKRLSKNSMAIGALVIVLGYAFIALLCTFGLLASDWQVEYGSNYQAPSFENLKLIFGTDIFGRSVLLKTVKGVEVAMSVGLLVGLMAITIGVVLGAIAGYFGGLIDEVIVWLYTTVSSVPNIMLLIAITLVMQRGMAAVYLALSLTSWVEICRLVRGEVIRQKDREYVQAAQALGASHFRKLFVHIIPNIMHIVIINFSLLFQTSIKSEVILSYLGLGVQGRPSWGTMIDDAKLELFRGMWWQLTASTLAMFGVVLAFNILGDALRDALDPKLRGK